MASYDYYTYDYYIIIVSFVSQKLDLVGLLKPNYFEVLYSQLKLIFRMLI